MRRLRIEAGQHERRMPVLRVYDVGLESEVRGAGEQRVAVEEESILVIVTSIDVRAPEIALVLEQIDRDAAHVRLPDIDTLSALRPRHADVREHVPQVERGALDRAVHRQRDADVGAALSQRARERARNVAEAAHFRERTHLNSGEQDIQTGYLWRGGVIAMCSGSTPGLQHV